MAEDRYDSALTPRRLGKPWPFDQCPVVFVLW